MKRGQVTLFVIIGLVLMILVFLLLFLFSKNQDLPIEEIKKPLLNELAKENWAEEVLHLSLEEADEVIEIITSIEQSIQEEIIDIHFQTNLFTALNQGGLLLDYDNIQGTSLGPITKTINYNGVIKPEINIIKEEIEHSFCNIIEQEIRQNYLGYEDFLSLKHIDCFVSISDTVTVNVNVYLHHELFDYTTTVFNTANYDINIKKLIHNRDYVIINYDFSNPGALSIDQDFSVHQLNEEELIGNLFYEYNGERRYFSFIFRESGAQ